MLLKELKNDASQATLDDLSAVVKEAEASIEAGKTSEQLEKLVKEANGYIANPENAGTLDVITCMVNLRNELADIAETTEIEKLKEGLQKNVDHIVNHVMNNTDGYRKDDIDAMNTLLKEAQDIINKADATKDEILDISHRLADQLTKMVKIDKSTLESVIETAKALDPEEYTEESYKALADAIAAGEVVLKR